MVNVPYKYSYELYDANRSKRILICFLLSPLLGFVLALKNIKQKSAFGVMFAFALLVGLCMDVPIDRINGDLNVDATTYREYFEEVSVSQNFGGWCEGLISFISLLASSIPIIAMTADAFAENIAECLAAGMNGHIAKPIDVKLVIKEIRRIREESKK